MVNPTLLNLEVQEFIRSYTEDTSVLAFKGSPFDNISIQELIKQIEGFRKTKAKLPHWHETPGIYFPNRLNLEQTSSEITADYKASLVQGSRLADITGGFGVDSYYFAKQFGHVDHFEKDELLSEIAGHNFNQLAVKNITCHAKDGLESIEQADYDVIFADPSRRNEAKGKVYFLADCEPNLVLHAENLLKRCHTMLVKTSPMLDISVGLEELPDVEEIHVVAVDNEVKELLWILRKDHLEKTVITASNIKKEKVEFLKFTFESPSYTTYSYPKTYLYEPNAAIMKSGGFKYISSAFGIPKIQKHSHLFTSKELVDFPGRVFEMKKIIPFRKKELRDELRETKANITIRNFPLTVDQLRRKLKIKEGGDTYLFFTTLKNNEKVVLCCSRMTS